MDTLKRTARSAFGFVTWLLYFWFLYQLILNGLRRTEDPLLRFAVERLNLDRCEQVAQGTSPAHPVEQPTAYPTLQSWLRDNPYFLCRFR